MVICPKMTRYLFKGGHCSVDDKPVLIPGVLGKRPRHDPFPLSVSLINPKEPMLWRWQGFLWLFLPSLGRTGLQDHLSGSAQAEDWGVLSSHQSLLRCPSCPQTEARETFIIFLTWVKLGNGALGTVPWNSPDQSFWPSCAQLDMTLIKPLETQISQGLLSSQTEGSLHWICTFRRLWWSTLPINPATSHYHSC